MAVSPADFELYSRATGAPYPRTAEERMRMAPEAYNYSRNFAREPNIVQKAAGTLGKAAQLGGALAGVYGLAKVLGPETTASAISALTKSDDPPPPPPSSPPGGGGGGNESYTPSPGGERERKRVTQGYDYGDSPNQPPPQRSGPQERAPWTPSTGGNRQRRDEQPSQGTSDEDILDIWGESPSPAQESPSPEQKAKNGLKSIVRRATTPVDQGEGGALVSSGATASDALRSIPGLWQSGGQGGQRFGPGARVQVDESEWKPGSWQVEKTERSLFNPVGRRLVKKPIVVGKNPDGSDKYMQSKAALTGGDRSLIPRQWPPAGRVNVGDAYASMMSGPGMSGLGPFFDGLTAHFGPLGDIHVPGALQIANWGIPVAAGLGRKGLGDAMEVADLAASGVGYVAKNLRPILKQGREDWSKGYRDIRTGVQDLGLVKDTANQLMLAAAMKRDQDLGLIEGGAQRVMTWAQKQRSLEGRPLSGTGQLEAGVEHDLGDNAQIDDPQQVHEQHQIPPSKGGFQWKRKNYGSQKAAERRMRLDAIRDQKIADFVNQYGTRQEWAQAEMDQAIAEQDLLDKQVAASREFGPDESTKYAEWGVQQGGRPFVRYQKGEPVRYEYETRPDLSRRIENFLTKGGFDYFSDVRPREIIDSTMEDPDIRKLKRNQ